MSVRSRTGPFAITPLWLLDAGLTNSELRVFIALATFADRDGACHPRIQRIAARAKVSQAATKRALYKLRDMGVVTATPVYGEDGGQLRNDYLIDFNDPGIPPRSPRRSGGADQSFDPPIEHTSKNTPVTPGVSYDDSTFLPPATDDGDLSGYGLYADEMEDR